MAKKLTAKVNGVKVKDGDLVTVVIQTRVKIEDRLKFDGNKYRNVEFVSTDEEQGQWIDAYATGDDDVKGPFTVDGATIVKVEA